MATEAEKTSPEVEFGTFLRLPHQSRTFSRPADAYIPSSPPSRPTSPTPAAPPPSTVFLHGRPAPVVSKMRQGAPRLGGLGLGGIEASQTPPPLPVRRNLQAASDTKLSPLPPSVPPVAASTSRSASPAPARTTSQTPNSTKLDQTDGIIQRPFLSPEMDKPVAREGAFALDRPKIEDVIKRSNEDGEAQIAEGGQTEEKEQDLSAGDHENNGRDDMSRTGEPEGTVSPEAFPSPEVGADEENGGLFDRFKSTLVSPEKDSKARENGDEDGGKVLDEDSDRGSINSTGESFFATPETVPAEEEEDEPIPDFVLNSSVTDSGPEQEEIAFDGPTELAQEKDQDDSTPQLDKDDSVVSQGNARSDDNERTRRLDHFRYDSTPFMPSVTNSLIYRADKSAPSDDPRHSPTASIATSVYNSREPSVQDLQLDKEEEEEEGQLIDSIGTSSEQHPKPSLKLPNSHPSDLSTSPTYSHTSSLPDDLSSPAYLQGLRFLSSDPASEYPSPPSSPATSVPDETTHHSLVNDDVSVYSVDQATKPSSPETEFIGRTSPPSIDDDSTLDSPATQEQLNIAAPQESETPIIHPRAETPPALAITTPTPSSSSPVSPYFDRGPSSARRSRFSYQGLGLRMPSSIAPKSATEEEPISQYNSSPPLSSPPMTSPSRNILKEKVPEESETRTGETSTSDSLLFPWIQSSAPALQSQPDEVPSKEESSRSQNVVVAGYQDETTSYPSSPSAYAPSSVASSPQITQAYRVPISSPSIAPVVSALPNVNVVAKAEPKQQETRPPPSALQELTAAAVVPPEPSPAILRQPSLHSPSFDTTSPASGETATATEQSKEAEEEGDPNQLSAAGVAVDIGAAVAGALVMGGLAVGQFAWRGLAVGWSAWRGASNQSVIQETKVLEVTNVAESKREDEEEGKQFKSYVRAKEAVDENDGSRKAESSVISTEWGEAEFDAPEGFLEEFKRAMAEIGEEDLAANEQAQIDAQLAAYQSASQQHVDAVASPTLSDNSSLASSNSSSPMAFPSTRTNRQRETSIRRPPPETIEEDSADEDERELEDLLAPVWDSPSRQSRISVEFPTRHGFAVPPGLTGSPSRPTSIISGSRPVSVISTSSMGSSIPNSPNLNAVPSSPRQPAKLSKTSKGILGFGRSKSTKNVSSKSTSRGVTPSPSLPGLTGSGGGRSSNHVRTSSVLSKESSSRSTTATTTVNNDASSQHSKTSSHKTAGRRSSIFNFGGGGGKDVPPVPTIESQIKDTTYISYSKPQRRNSNASSISTGLYASRDPYLVAPTPGVAIPIATPSQPQTRSRERTTSSTGARSLNSSQTSRSEDLGGAPLGRRKSSLRANSAYDGDGGGDGGSQLTRSSSIIVEGGKKLYRVRFGNAVGGIGLRSVADSEAERAGGDRYGQRWVGVGRGRYGNMIIKTDEESDMVYAEQVAQIKKKWRAFGSEQSRDWAAVRIDK